MKIFLIAEIGINHNGDINRQNLLMTMMQFGWKFQKEQCSSLHRIFRCPKKAWAKPREKKVWNLDKRI